MPSLKITIISDCLCYFQSDCDAVIIYCINKHTDSSSLKRNTKVVSKLSLIEKEFNCPI